MKKEIMAVSLLAAMMLTSIINIRCIEKLTNEISEIVGQSVEAAEAEDWLNAEINVRRAETMWNEKDGYTHIVLRHTEIDTVSDALYDLIKAIFENNSQSAAAEAEKVLYHLDSISRMEQLRLGSIF